MDSDAHDAASSAAASSRVSHALDIFASAPKLPAYSIHAQQQLLHQDRPQPLPSSHASAPAPPLSATASFQSSSRHYFQQQQQQPPEAYTQAVTSSDSQGSTSSASTDTDRLFTPSVSEGELSQGGGGSANGSANAHPHEHDVSSQESQLLQLSRLAAARERMADVSTADAFGDGALSRKRAADGSVKHTRNASSTSPVRAGGHSRNTSTVSIASTAGSRIGELSAELKARLSYAMVKVNNGWQAHSIDQVENLASHAGSPTSSTSTIHGRHASSVSPRIAPASSHRRHQSHAGHSSFLPANTTIATTSRALSALDTSVAWPSSQQSSRSAQSTPPLPSPLGPPRTGSAAPPRALAPPASIQPARPSALSRRNSNPGFAPPSLAPSFSHSHSHNASPHTPGYESAAHGTPAADPILFSPHQNVREQDAIETLLFMSSPGNSSNMKHFPSFTASQPLPSSHHDPHAHAQRLASPQRHALPTGAPRKSLPTGRPQPQTYSSQPPPGRRAGLDRPPGHHRAASDMDLDEPYGTPYSRSSKGTPRRRANVAYSGMDMPTPRMKVPLSMPSGLSVPSKPRPVLGEDEIEKMLDRAAAASADDSSDSESEILIPVRRANLAGI